MCKERNAHRMENPSRHKDGNVSKMLGISAMIQPDAELREKVAKILDPRAWEPHKGAIGTAMQARRDDTLAKIDAIIPLVWNKACAWQLEQVAKWADGKHTEHLTNPTEAAWAAMRDYFRAQAREVKG